jgi:SAM-dependent methyltransferase
MRGTILEVSKDKEECYGCLFVGTAPYYAKYRPSYPAELFWEIVKFYKLDGQGQLLDLGTGTGQLAIPLSAQFASVIAVDPVAEMLVEGEKAAAAAGSTNINWRLGRSDEIATLGVNLRLTTIGRSFHWMDRDQVLKDLYRLTERDGGVVIASESRLRNSTNTNLDAITDGVVAKFRGEWRKAGCGLNAEPGERHEEVIARSAFTLGPVFRKRHEQRWTIDTVVGRTFSTSFASPAVLAERLPAFEQELRKELQLASPSGEFREEVETEAFFLKR